jgi:acetolactate synthase-1/2/3 large subunit
LTADIEGIARPVSSWVRTAKTSEGLAVDGVAAVQAALTPNPNPLGNIATLIVPADCAWGPGRATERAGVARRPKVAEEAIAAVAPRVGVATVLLMDGEALSEAGIRAAARVAAATGCTLMSTTFPARIEQGPGVPEVARMPYFPEQIMETLAGVEHIVLAGAEAPVSFFAYPNLPSDLVPQGCGVARLVHKHEDVVDALMGLADALDAPASVSGVEASRPEAPTGPLNTYNVALLLGALVPDDSIIAADSGGGGAAYPVLQRAARHSWLNLTGGSIGQGGPAATGAAIACPNRQVFALLGDGGAMYTNQCLWTQARENLDVITVIFSNGAYGILDVEYRRLGVNEVGSKAASMFDLTGPDIDWVSLATAQGVTGARAETCEAFTAALARALASGGPHLIEAKV